MSRARANGVTLEYDVVGEGDPGEIRPWMEEVPGAGHWAPIENAAGVHDSLATFLREAR